MWSFFRIGGICIKKIIIKGVQKGSIAEEIGLKQGDIILSINQEKIIDILDYKFQIADSYVELEIEHENKQIEIYEIEKDEDEDLGIIFESELIDEPRSCHNKCIFCFMEQLPKHVRDTLIFKDDDYRLSFFSGNYITMTNMKEEDVDRIIRYHLSPINISIHATDEQVRCKMLNNRFAGRVISYLEKLSKAGIQINTQIVLCKGINDGKILEKTIHDLAKYRVNSICIVPVGLSKYRDKLYPLEELTKQDCNAVIDLVEPYQKEFKEKWNTPLVFLADEFYLKAERKMPKYTDYKGFGQIEDGIGMCVLFDHDFKKEIEHILPIKTKEKVITMITGKIAEEYIAKKAKKLEKKLGNVRIQVIAIENHFFGEKITVTGLLTGKDIKESLLEWKKAGNTLGEYLVLPRVMLKEDEDIFLDDTRLEELQEALDIPIVVTDGSAKEFIHACMLDSLEQPITKIGEFTLGNSYENSI